jgi:hypothetical protein
MTIEEIIAANKKSAEEEAANKALHRHDYCSADYGCKACRDWYQAQRPPRPHYTFVGIEHERRYEALAEVERDNVHAAIADSHRYDEANN